MSNCHNEDREEVESILTKLDTTSNQPKGRLPKESTCDKKKHLDLDGTAFFNELASKHAEDKTLSNARLK